MRRTRYERHEKWNTWVRSDGKRRDIGRRDIVNLLPITVIVIFCSVLLVDFVILYQMTIFIIINHLHIYMVNGEYVLLVLRVIVNTYN